MGVGELEWGGLEEFRVEEGAWRGMVALGREHPWTGGWLWMYGSRHSNARLSNAGGRVGILG